MANITQGTVLYGASSGNQTPMARWNGHTFEVSPSVIRGFTDMKIKGGSDTKNKKSNGQKYVKRQTGSVRELSMAISLHAYLGVTDVYGEAMSFVNEANSGACDYFYLGEGKLFPAKMMLTSAEVIEIVHYPGQGAKWISCKVNVTFKQGSKSGKKKKSKKKKGKGGSGSKVSGKAKGGAKDDIASKLSASRISGKDSHAHQNEKYWVSNANSINKNASRASSAKRQWFG